MGLDGAAADQAELPHKVGSFALRASGGMVLATDAGVFLGDPFGEPGTLALLADYPEPELQAGGGRFNDGCCDPAGRFVVGTMDMAKQGRACAYSFEPGAKQGRKVLEGFSTFNGLAFTPDGSAAWFADTPQRKVWRASYDLGTGDFGPRDLVLEFPAGEAARPDGASFDEQGNYWLAMYAGGMVNCINPAGEITQKVVLPATYTTMAAFAGDNLDVMVVTTAGHADAEELQRNPQAGGLFSVAGIGATGILPAMYAG